MLFVVGGFALVVAGAPLGWAWVRNRMFRLVHLGAIVFVAAESLAGIACPLTVLEDTLRQSGSGSSFVGRWVAWLLYYDLPEWVFATAYVMFALAVGLAWRLIPPRPRKSRAASRNRPGPTQPPA